jgi:hypothetical protein
MIWYTSALARPRPWWSSYSAREKRRAAVSGENVLRFHGVGNMLEREYRNTPAYQWARELVRNGIEADAHLIQIGVEWRAVEARGVYRLQYADDGYGMSRDDLRTYMSTLGEGSKIVGGPHDNYAIGCRMTLLPWNLEGVVVISVADGDTNMVKMKYDPDSSDGAGEYVLEEVEWLDESGEPRLSTVYPPYVDEDLGIDWAETIPDFITQVGQGTTFILLGRSEAEDTFNGDVDRDENVRVLTRKYFNTRFWELPEGVTLRCLEFIKPGDRTTWPRTVADTDLYQYRTVKGARDVVEYVRRDRSSTIEDQGTVELPDGTRAHWWLRQPDVDTGGVGASSGFIAVLYRKELFSPVYASQEDGDTRIGANVYRQFGIGADTVRRRVFMVLEPPEYDETDDRRGVAPSTGRADLYWMGAGLSPRSVKPSDWADELAERMPDAIQKALSAAHEDVPANNEERQERLKRVMDRLSKRWRAPRARVSEEGDTTTRPSSPGTAPRQRPDVPVSELRKRRTRKRVIIRGRSGSRTLGQPGVGTERAKSTVVRAGYPDCQWVTAEDINERGMIAAWQPPSKTNENGLIQLDETHPVIRGQIEYWQSQYPRALAQQVENIVKEAYVDVAIAKVSHMHALSGPVISDEQLATMLENPALTASLVGLLGEDALITPRLGGLGAKRKRPEEADSPTESAA